MTDLIATQFVGCTIIVIVFSISLRRGVLVRLFGKRFEERDLIPVKWTIAATEMYLIFFIGRDLWKVIR